MKASIVAPSQYDLPICYEDCVRKIIINDSFSNPVEYARQFSSALIEEIILSITSGIKGIEKRVFRALSIDELGFRFSLSTNNDTGIMGIDVQK